MIRRNELSVALYIHICVVQSNQRISVDWKVPSAVILCKVHSEMTPNSGKP